ncbi:MAG TPA: glycosyltransferase family 2 protein [Stellaceae bacterium]|nr:glycosyltransferase family 2 protein [Stellaceae bacterium]
MVQPATYFHYSNPVQRPFDAAVVIPTTCRSSLVRAVHSVFHQIGVQRIHTLIGIDAVRGDDAVIEEILDTRPARHAVTVLNLGYSTSIRHGGFYGTIDGGALRTILTYAANSRYVCYLDDDNWFGEAHIVRLLSAIQDRDWAFSLRWYVDPDTNEPLAVDRWESVGPDAGVFKPRFGGFVDPNCLMIDKLRCADVPPLWSRPLKLRTPTADRTVFEALRQKGSFASTGEATSYYVTNTHDENHAIRLRWIKALEEEQGKPALREVTPFGPDWARTHRAL